MNPPIVRNSNDQLVFPSIDMNGMAIGDMGMLLSDYFDQCWGKLVIATGIPRVMGARPAPALVPGPGAQVPVPVNFRRAYGYPQPTKPVQ